MSFKIIRLLAIFLGLFFMSCEKDFGDSSDQTPTLRYPSEDNTMSFDLNDKSWEACGIFLTAPHMEIAHHYIPEDPEYGKLELKGNRFGSCVETIDYHYTSTISLKMREDVVTYDKKRIDLNDNLFVEQIRYAEWGDDPNNNFEAYHYTYDKIIDGELIIDSLLLPDAEKELHGKIWCSFWVDLSLSDKDLAQGETQNIVKIRNGQFDLTTWWD